MILRPCGACAAMVTVSGCEHWQPKPEQLVVASGRPADARARQREYERAARARAADAVARFRETMTR